MTTSASYHDHMDVGIRELKAHLSEYVDRAAAGEVIRVTDRGTPRAVLMPLPVRDRIDQGLAEGWVTRLKTGTPGALTPVRATGTLTVADSLAEDRG